MNEFEQLKQELADSSAISARPICEGCERGAFICGSFNDDDSGDCMNCGHAWRCHGGNQ